MENWLKCQISPIIIIKNSTQHQNHNSHQTWMYDKRQLEALLANKCTMTEHNKLAWNCQNDV